MLSRHQSLVLITIPIPVPTIAALSLGWLVAMDMATPGADTTVVECITLTGIM